MFVYKLGNDWGDKKSICNKFEVPSPVTCVSWPANDPGQVAFGCLDGSVRLGILKTNKTDTLYSKAPVTCIASSPDGRSLVSGHADGAIVTYDFADSSSYHQLVVHPCAPAAVAWGADIAATGSSGHVLFYDSRSGRVRSSFPPDPAAESVSVQAGAMSPAGDVFVVAGWDQIVAYGFKGREGRWERTGTREVPHMYAGTAMAFRPDGSGVAVGTVSGCVDVYESMLRKVKYVSTDAAGNPREVLLSYTSKSQVRLKDVATGASLSVGSAHGYEIESVKVIGGEFVAATTSQSLVVGSMSTRRFSEVPWQSTGRERFFCDDPGLCMVYNMGELTALEYGAQDVLWTGRTEYASKYVRSACLVPARGPGPAVKRLAYLLDAQTARVVDLQTGAALAALTHDAKITWLELSHRGTHLLFKDKRNNLYLLDVEAGTKKTLAPSVGYCQWAPASDVVVAQSGSSLVVWYSVTDQTQQHVTPLKGDVTDMVRVGGKTLVTVTGAESQDTIELDESSIVFDAALEAGDWWAAVEVLSGHETAEADSRWRTLGQRALEDQDLVVAEMAYAMVGDLAKARYIQRIRQAASESEKATGRPGMQHWSVKSRMEALAGRHESAEAIMLQNGAVEDAIELHKGMGRWDDAIRVAERYAHPEGNKLKRTHYQWLLETRQEDKAAMLKEREGDHLAAISLYLRGGYPARAAKVIMAQSARGAQVEPSLVASVTAALKKAGMHQVTGQLMAHHGDYEGALEEMKKGRCFDMAVELCRKHFPEREAEVEDVWGEWHATNRQWDAAVNHFHAAQNYERAIDAAIHAKQWAKAVSYARTALGGSAAAAPVYRRVAVHYQETGDLLEAEKLYREAGAVEEAWNMYVADRQWDAALRVATECLLESEKELLYLNKARELERAGNLKDAERLYLSVDEGVAPGDGSGDDGQRGVDKAISMYKKEGRFDDVIRLVSKHRRDLLTKTHRHLAQQLESQGRLREAEKHHVDAREWKAAVHMYRNAEQWDDALRVAKACGGPAAAKQVAFARAVALGGEAGAQYLSKHGLVEQAIEYAVESANFEMAFELARTGSKAKEQEVHLKYAMYLEDEGDFTKAEEHFVRAVKPREAIDMWLHQQEFAAAMRVAEGHDAASIRDIQVAQGTALAEQGALEQAERLFVDAREPERAVNMYRDLGDWGNALRVAQAFLPAYKQRELSEAHAAAAGGARGGGGGDALAVARGLEKQRNFPGAIEAYLSVSEGDLADPDKLQGAWEQAVALAEDYTPDDAPRVVKRAAAKLAGIRRHGAAADLYLGIRDARGAAQVYVDAGMFPEAARVAQESGDAGMVEWVRQQENAGMVSRGDAEGLAAAGSGQQSLDVLVQRGQWERVHEMARPMGADVANAYAAKHVQLKVQARDFGGAAEVLASHMVAVDPKYAALYISVAKGALAAPRRKDTKEAAAALKKAMQAMSDAPGAPQTEEARRLRDAAHFLHLHHQCAADGLGNLAAMQATALVRCIPAVPADKAFYLAGSAWRAAAEASGGTDEEAASMAFVMLNKALDIYDAMEEEAQGGSPAVEMADFLETDLPTEVPLPREPYLGEDEQEGVREWVLEKSMEQSVEQTLHQRMCHRCSADTFKGSLECHACRAATPQCCVSGYPVEDRHTCSANPSHVCSRDWWNLYVDRYQACPVCDSPQRAQY